MLTISDQEYIEAMRSKQAFEDLMRRISTQIIEDALKVLPRVTAQLIKTSVSIQNMAEDFKTRNPQLKGKEELVQQTIMQVEKEMPAANYDKILAEAEARLATLNTPQLSLNLREIGR